MAGIETQLKLIDKYSSPMNRIAAQTERVIQRMERMQRLAKSGMGLDKLPSTQAKVESSQKKVTEEIKRSKKAADGLVGSLKGIIGTYLTLQGVASGIQAADNFTNTKARLDLINDGTRTTVGLQEEIFKAAERSRGSYGDMAAAVSRMGILASEAFSNNDETVAFTELVQKTFRIGGSSTMEQQAGMYQLSQAMAAGKLQGDEFRSIMENAPLLADAISKFTGRSKGDLKEMSAEGEITAEIILGSVFFMADEIDRKLETMPMTFGDTFKEMGNQAVKAFEDTFNRMNGFLNSDIGQQAIQGITNSLVVLASVMSGIIDIVINIATVFVEHWGLITTLTWTLAGAMTALYLVSKSQAIISGVMAARAAVLSAVTYVQTVATVGLTAAWHALNTAMKANVIILIISLIISLVAWVIDLWKTNDDFAIGIVKIWHGILNFFDKIPAYFWTLVEAMAKPFGMWAKTIGKVYDLVINGIITGINTVLGLVNKLTGSSYEIQGSFSMEAVADKIENFAAGKKDAAFTRAAEKEAERAKELEAFTSKRKNSDPAGKAAETNTDYSQFGRDASDLANPTGGKLDEVGKIKDSVDISSEDLKAIRELAEINSIKNFVTLQPQVSFGDMNIRQDGRSIEEIVSHIDGYLTDTMIASAKGVYNV